MKNGSDSKNGNDSILKDLALSVTNRIGQPFVLSYILVWMSLNLKFVLITLPSSTSIVDLGNQIYTYHNNTEYKLLWFIGYILLAFAALGIYQLIITTSFWLIEWIRVRVRPSVSRIIYKKGWKPMADFLNEKEGRIKAEENLEQLEMRVRSAVAHYDDEFKRNEKLKVEKDNLSKNVIELNTQISNVLLNKGHLMEFIDSELNRINELKDVKYHDIRKLYIVLFSNIKRLLANFDLNMEKQEYLKRIDEHRIKNNVLKG